jgi:hypothetical protein
MPWSYRVDPDARLLLVTGEGVVTQDERFSAIRAWLDDKDYRPGFNTLLDLTGAVSTPTMADMSEIITFIQRRAERIGRKKLAAVTARAATYGVMRQFQTLATSDPLQVRIFDSREAALAWLREG